MTKKPIVTISLILIFILAVAFGAYKLGRSHQSAEDIRVENSMGSLAVDPNDEETPKISCAVLCERVAEAQKRGGLGPVIDTRRMECVNPDYTCNPEGDKNETPGKAYKAKGGCLLDHCWGGEGRPPRDGGVGGSEEVVGEGPKSNELYVQTYMCSNGPSFEGEGGGNGGCFKAGFEKLNK